MFARKILAVAITAALLAACDNGGGGHGGVPGPDDSVTADTASLTMPEQVDIVSAKAADARSRARMASARAHDDPGTDYSNAEQRYHVWHPALKPTETVNEILCFISQLKGTEFAGEGNYVALIDKDSCEKGTDSGSTGNESESASNATTYVRAIVNASRATSTSPLQIKAWLPEMPMGPQGDTMTLLLNIIISSGATEEKPYGDFHMSFGFFPSVDSASASDGSVDLDAAVGRGELYTIESGTNVGFNFYMENSAANEMGGPGDGPSELADLQDELSTAKLTETAAVLTSPTGDTGAAITQSTLSGIDEATKDLLKTYMSDLFTAFGIAYNDDNVLVGKASEISEVAGTDDKQCLSRNNFTEAVWRYGVYDSADGSEVELNSGFPFRYDSDDDGEEDAFGHAGYWGVWTEDQNADLNGATITRQTFGPDSDNSAASTYTVTQVDGRLIKKTVETIAVSELVGTQFEYWDNGQSYTVEYFNFTGTSDDGFYMTAAVSHGDGGPSSSATECGTTRTLSGCAEDRVTPYSDFENSINLMSRELGGSVRWQLGASVITFFREEFVSSANLDSALDLVCYNQCPKAGLTPDSILFYSDAFDQAFGGTSTVEPYSYGFSLTGDGANLLIRNTGTPGAIVLSGTADDWQGSMFGFGYQSGMLIERSVAEAAGLPVTTAEIADQSIFSVLYDGTVDEFFEWRTGFNSWDKQTIITDDSTGETVPFDKPIQVAYTHSADNDRSGSADFAGRTFLLEYGGKGQLWGFPMENISGDGASDDSRYYPVFNLADGTTLDDSGNTYVVKALDIEQFMQEESASTCSSLSLTSVPSPASGISTDYDLQIGSMPEVSADEPASVVGGVVQVQ